MIDILIAHKNHSFYLENQLIQLTKAKGFINNIIIVDDYSDELNFKNLLCLNEKYEFKLIRNNNEAGMHNSYNIALNSSEATYVYFASCDDNVNPQFIINGIKVLNDNDGTNILVSEITENYYFNNDIVKKIKNNFLYNQIYFINSNEYINLFISGKRYFSGGATIYKREFIKKMGGYISILGLYADIYPQIIGGLSEGLLYLPIQASEVKIKINSYNVSRANNWKLRRIDGFNFIKLIHKNNNLHNQLIQIKIGNITSSFFSCLFHNPKLIKYFDFNFKNIIIEIVSFIKIYEK
jgi:cellulose synthase/poly-beta-1,6-N-acetylglucosamine synthase-like glycosyltransferase